MKRSISRMSGFGSDSCLVRVWSVSGLCLVRVQFVFGWIRVRFVFGSVWLVFGFVTGLCLTKSCLIRVWSAFYFLFYSYIFWVLIRIWSY